MNTFLPIIHTFEAGETARFLAPGCIGCSVAEADSPIDIEFIDESYQPAGRAVGCEVGMAGGPSLTKPFQWIEVTSAKAQTIKLFVYGGSFSVAKLAGEVTINGVAEISPDFSRVVAGQAFCGTRTYSPDSGNFAHIGFFNYSDLSFCLSELSFFAGDSAGVSIYGYSNNADLIAALDSYSGYSLRSLLIGGAVAADKMFFGQSDAAETTAAETNAVLLQWGGSATEVAFCVPEAPVVVPKNQGVLLITNSAGVDLTARLKGFYFA